MNTVTDWLTSIGTVSAVIISLSYTIVSHALQKKHRRHNLIRRSRLLSENLFNELEKTPAEQGDISKLKLYNVFKTYQQVLMFSADDANGDILMLGENMLNSLVDYSDDRSETHRDACLDIMKQINEAK